MASPVSSWNTVRVYGSWVNGDGTRKVGKWKLVIPVRITNEPQDVIIPSWTDGGDLAVAPGVPSLDIQVPSGDDPDNTPTGFKPILTVTFLDGTPTEVYSLDVPVSLSGDPDGVNLRKVFYPSVVPDAQSVIFVGTPGGVAKLDTDGDVVDSDGNKVTGLALGETTTTAFQGSRGKAAEVAISKLILADVDVTENNAVLELSKTNRLVGTGPYVAPDLSAVGQEFAVRNVSNNSVYIQWPDSAGEQRSSLILPGVARSWRQSTALGYDAKDGVIPLAQLDARYAPIFSSAHIVNAAGSAQDVPAPSATVGTVHQYGLTDSSCAFTLPTGMKDSTGAPAQVDLVLYLVNSGGGARAHTYPNTVTFDSGGKPDIPSASDSVTIVTFTTMNGGSSWLASSSSLPSTLVSKTLFTTKGDLLVGTGNGAVARLAAPGAVKIFGSDANNNLGWIDLPASASVEDIQDAAAVLFSSGGHTGITFSYDDAGNRIVATVDSVAYPLTWQPVDNNLVAANVAPSAITGQNTMVAGRDYACKVRVRKNQQITGFLTFLGSLGTATDNAGYYAALYDSTGNLVASTGDISNSFKSTGTATVEIPWSAPWTPSVDQQVYLVIHTGTTSGTQPKLAQASTLIYMNARLTSNIPAGATSLRAAVPANSWSGSTPPATLGNLSATNALAFFAGLY